MMWTCDTQIHGFTHVTLEYLVENTVHEVFLLFKEFPTIIIVFRPVVSIQDLLIVMGCGCD